MPPKGVTLAAERRQRPVSCSGGLLTGDALMLRFLRATARPDNQSDPGPIPLN